MMNIVFKLAACILIYLFSLSNADAVVRIEPLGTTIVDEKGGLRVELGLSGLVSYRIFTLSHPNRIVMDFEELDWSLMPKDILSGVRAIKILRYGLYRSGWSRLVFLLNRPLLLSNAELDTRNYNDGGAQLWALFYPVSQVEFDQKSHQQLKHSSLFPNFYSLDTLDFSSSVKGDRIRVALDPGHGGLDHGAIHKGYSEKNLVLQMALELKKALLATGNYDVVMTRESDIFYSLLKRILLARSADADIFISLHADALVQGDASGVTVYVLSQKASDASTELLAKQLSRSDLLVGVDLQNQDDELVEVLMDMARLETKKRSELLAEQIIRGIANSIDESQARPYLSAPFAVLKAPDIPSVLIELGFMTNERDLRNLLLKSWRHKVIAGIIQALDVWSAKDRLQNELLRR